MSESIPAGQWHPVMDADALGDDDARSPHFVRWLDDARILLGFRHTEDALARAIVVDVSSKTVTTYAADLGDTVVAFFYREAPGAQHTFFAASSRSGLCLVACNLSRDVGVVREDPEQPGAYYLHEAYDEADRELHDHCLKNYISIVSFETIGAAAAHMPHVICADRSRRDAAVGEPLGLQLILGPAAQGLRNRRGPRPHRTFLQPLADPAPQPPEPRRVLFRQR